MEIIFWLIGFFVLAIASFCDIQTREIPDWLSWGSVFAGIGLRIIYSLLHADISFLLYGFIGLGFMFLLGMLMFYCNLWGGGDGKILMGIGAIIGFNLSLDLFACFIFSLIFLIPIYMFFYKKIFKSFHQEMPLVPCFLFTFWVSGMGFVLMFI